MSAPRRFYPPHPRRIMPLAPVGSMLKRVAAPAVRPPKTEAERDPAYLALVRDLPCLHCGTEPSEAAHVRMASAAFGKASGLGKKPEDRWALPLCSADHRLLATSQHERGEQQFWADLGISPLIVCEQLYAQRCDLVAMRAVVLVAIAGRQKKD